MVCPNCGTNVADDALICPACHLDLGRTVIIPKLQGAWCSACGSLIPSGADVCPSCGTPTAGASYAPAKREEQEEREDSSPDETNVMPRIESAIPSEPEAGAGDAIRDVAPRTRTAIVAALSALLVVGGSVLYITHPWNPAAYDQRAKVEADTSMAGFPGVVDTLSGQDAKSSVDEEVKSADQLTYEALVEAYAKLGSLSAQVDASESLLFEVGFGSDDAARASGRDSAYQLTLDISNLVATMQEVDVTSGTYVDEKQTLLTLGNYLRNRMDALYASWELDLSYSGDDVADHRGEILDPMGGEDKTVTSSYKSLFDKLYATSEPALKS